jgi:cell division protease FtsH
MAESKSLRASRIVRFVAFAVMMLGVFWLLRDVSRQKPQKVSLSEVARLAEAGEIREAEITLETIELHLVSKDGKKTTVIADRIPDADVAKLVETMEQHGANVSGRADKMSPWTPLLWTIAPMPFLLLLSWLLSGGVLRGKGRPMSFGKSQAKLYDRSAENSVTFADVAGVDEAKAELVEIVRFLKDPSRYRAAGARIPKGVLLVGAPGTGKTLLARAVAGESGVPFFSMSGSEFVEMFVGVGASRVRDLFEQAKERAPCIIFIDELDAIGKSRAGATGFVANEEREQTLNQLLVEMDGFDSTAGIVIMAATNRPEILDKALLRAGRFDRQVVVDRPDVRGREAILRVHAKKIQLGPDVDLGVVARRTPGMVGADLANVVNEAALAAVRRNAGVAEMRDFEEAIDRIQLGLKKEARLMSEEEKRRVAYHESGHALVALSVEHADPVHRVTIIPRSVGALGATLQLPTEERYLMTRNELADRLCVLLAGRSAEEIACADVSTGAENDLESATELARLMVCRFGMSEKIGPRTCGNVTSRFLPAELDHGNVSEETSRVIDLEIKSLLEREHARARRIISERRDVLEAIAKRLLATETLERAELEALAAAPRPKLVAAQG